MALFDPIRRILYHNDEPLRHGHVYVDNVTGESFKVDSIGRRVEITRYDAKSFRDVASDPKLLRRALRMGVIEHDDERCDCTDV